MKKEIVPQLGGAPEDLRNVLCAVIENFGIDGVGKVTEYVMLHRGKNAFNGKIIAEDLGFQTRVAEAHHALFDDDPTDISERASRFLEESLETFQAFGMSREDAHALVDYTFDRPVGDPLKEVGGAYVTLNSLCVVAGIDLMACAEVDLANLQKPETIARIRAKRSTRDGRGALPGLDPAPAATGSYGDMGVPGDNQFDPGKRGFRP